MEQGAAWLCERVLPPVPLRQWVLSLPRALRYLLAYDGKLLRAVSSAAMREVFRFLRLRARKVLGLLSTRHALPGALIAVQRFGSSLNLNIHFHSLVLDGVYARDAFGTPTFFELPPPTLEDLNRVVARVAKAVLALLHRRGVWLEDAPDEEDPVAQRSGSLAEMARASLTGTLVFGRAGAKPVRLQDAPVRAPALVERVGRALGFTLDTAVRVSAHNRLHRERLCRYLLRPPLAKGRLHETVDGRYAFELKAPWSDGTRVLFFSGQEVVARLAALVPPPRMHLVHYYGVLAPHAKIRSRIVPEPPDEDRGCGHSVVYQETRTGKTIRRRWVPWAELLLKVFQVDVFDCPECHGRMARIAWITEAKTIKAILACVERKERPP